MEIKAPSRELKELGVTFWEVADPTHFAETQAQSILSTLSLAPVKEPATSAPVERCVGKFFSPRAWAWR